MVELEREEEIVEQEGEEEEMGVMQVRALCFLSSS